MATNLQKLSNIIKGVDLEGEIEKDPKQRSIRRVEDILKLVTDGITKEEFVKSFESIVNLILKVEKSLIEKQEKIRQTLKLLGESVRDNSSLSLSETKTKIDKRLSEIRDGSDGKDGVDGKDGISGKDGADGKDADIQEVISLILRELPIEGLEEKIDILKKEMTRLRQMPLGRAMGPSVITPRPLSNITPTGSINGSNTAFVLPKAPKTDSERVYLNGVRMRKGSDNDYTVSAKTITFNTAPLTDDIILVDIDF